MTSTGTGPPKRDTYRHGDLRRALLEAGTELARAGGPDAVVLREATRRAGVAPSAAYRHFANRGALLDAVCLAAQAALAEAMEAELDGLPNGGPLPKPHVRACAPSAPATCSSPRPSLGCSGRPSRRRITCGAPPAPDLPGYRDR